MTNDNVRPTASEPPLAASTPYGNVLFDKSNALGSFLCGGISTYKMTRLGPLASQALGRSPYDIVVPGEGEDNPQAPTQRYDERGRPVNEETKRFNRAIVRSHNEVMHVIGAAEPDSGTVAVEAEAQQYLKQLHHEDALGLKLKTFGRFLAISGVWGISATRQRILLYRQYSDIPFHQLFRHEWTRQPPMTTLLTGLPVFMTLNSMWQSYMTLTPQTGIIWKRLGLRYIWMHLQLFFFQQRLGLVPATPWYPGLFYLVPFSPDSPIGRPPPFPTSITVRSVLQWTGMALLNVAPLAVLYGYTNAYAYVTQSLYGVVFKWLPNTVNPSWSRFMNQDRHITATITHPDASNERRPQPVVQQDRAEVDGGEVERDDAVRNQEQPAQQSEEQEVSGLPEQEGEAEESEQPVQPHPGQQTMQPLPPPPPSPTQSQAPESRDASQRRNTISSGGDDASSEEEEYELSTTLISFDVETADANENAPPNTWHAELRQSSGLSGSEADGVNGGDNNTVGAYVDGVFLAGNVGPLYADNTLTRLPALLATDALTETAATVIVVPYEAFSIRVIAWMYRLRHGQPVDDLYGLNPLSLFASGGSALFWRQATQVGGLLMLHLVVKGASWLIVTGLATLARGSKPGANVLQILQEKLGFGKKEDNSEQDSGRIL